MPLVAAAGAFLGTAAGAATATAAVGALGTAYASNQNSKSVDKQIANQNATTAQVQAAQAAQAAQTRSDFAPAVGVGNSALDKLAQKYGLTSTGGAATSPGGGSKFDIPAYIAQNPDVAQTAQQLQAQGVIGPNGQWKTAEDWVSQVQLPNAQANGEQRNYPTVTQPEAAPAPAADPNNPMTTPAPVYERPGQGAAPDSGQFFGNYEESPDYQFLRDKALKAVNNQFGARGVLRSGGAARELMREASGLASQDKNQWFGRQNTLYQSALQQFNLDRGNTNANFNTDAARGLSTWADARDYATGRDTSATNDLFRLAGVGQSALGTVASAGSNATNNSGNVAMAGTSALNGLYQQQADNKSALAGAFTGLGQSALAAFGGGGASYSPVSYQPGQFLNNPNYQTGPLTQSPQPRF